MKWSIGLPALMLAVGLAGPTWAEAEPQAGTLAAYRQYPEGARQVLIAGIKTGAVSGCEYLLFALDQVAVAREKSEQDYNICLVTLAFVNLTPPEIEAALSQLAREDFAGQVSVVEALHLLGLSRQGDPQRHLDPEAARAILAAKVAAYPLGQGRE